jgi:serine/threonine protein kinase/tetratricopeptide (TPR) repeat protein
MDRIPPEVGKHLPSDRVRFGQFELNVRTGELYPADTTDGSQRVLLREQPFQILRILIERGGKIVTRDEIKAKLWPNDTIVDFGHSINVAMGVLRRALGDSADSPRYIETLARRGYRLMVDTEWLASGGKTTAPNPDVQPAASAIHSAAQESGLIGRKVSHYRVLEVIGGGGMGMVYKAEDLKLGRRVALKFLPEELSDDSRALRRFEREAQTASALNHPNICTIYEIEEYSGQPFIVMELLEGDTLQQHLEKNASCPLAVNQLLDIAIQICNGLEAAHQRGVIHRDIKPANIYLTSRGQVKILDFGLAKLVASEETAGNDPAEASKNDHHRPSAQSVREHAKIDASLTRHGITAGTAAYMSPEQVRKEKLDARTDLFSFGMVVYEMAAGRRAFEGETVAEIHDAILHQTAAPAHDANPNVSSALDAVISKALEKDRERRYRSAAEMREDLARVRKRVPPARRRLLAWMAVAALVLIAASGIWIYSRVRGNVAFSAADTVILVVTNRTGDPVFDDALYTALRVGLEQTPYLNVLADDKVRGAMRSLNLPPGAKLTPEIARQVCLSTNSRMVVASSIADAGNGFRIEIAGIDCQSGATVTRVQKDAVSRNEIVRVLGLSAARLRVALGEPRASMARFNKPLEEATSSSPEALQFLTEGYRRHLGGDPLGALPYYKRATDTDPEFALAYTALGLSYYLSGDFASSEAAEKKAFELRNRLTEVGRFHAENIYYDAATGEEEKACSVAWEWVQTFPQDFIAHHNFANCSVQLGQLDRALAEYREAARLLPSAWSYTKWISGSIETDRFDEAVAIFNEADKRNFDNTELRRLRFLLAFLKNDHRVMQEQLDWAAARPDAAPVLLYERSRVQAYYGHFREARMMREQAVAHGLSSSWNAGAGVGKIVPALQEVEVGNIIPARREATDAVRKGLDPDGQLAMALVFARAGDIEQAGKLGDAVSQNAPLDTVVQNYCLPSIRATMKLNQHDPAAAVEILRGTVKYDLSVAPCFNALYPAYIRGLAYLELGQPRMAAAEFQKLLDHPGMVGRDVTSPLVRLQLGRAYKIMGDQVTARKWYEEFLTIWKDADPDIPILKQAKAEYAKLH